MERRQILQSMQGMQGQVQIKNKFKTKQINRQLQVDQKQREQIKQKKKENIIYRQLYKLNINRMFYAVIDDNKQYVKQAIKQSYRDFGKIYELLSESSIQNFTVKMKNNPNLFLNYRQIIYKYVNIGKIDNEEQHTEKSKFNLTEYVKCQELLDQVDQIHQRLRIKTKLLKQLVLYLRSRGKYEYQLHQMLIKKVCRQIRYVVYLPTITKVTLSDVNRLNFNKKEAFISMKIQVKVNVKGYSKSPQIYQEFFKKNMRLSLKSQNHSLKYKQKIKISEKQTQNYSCSYYGNAYEYFVQVLKWKNYSLQKQDNIKELKNFQGFIISVIVKQFRTSIDLKDKFSPFLIIDLNGIIQVQPIKTKASQWFQFFPEQIITSQLRLKQLIEEQGPIIQIKFNQISLYIDDTIVTPTNKILFNHIHSFDCQQHDQFILAQNLMLLQTSNVRVSRYGLQYNFLGSGYKWEKIQRNPIKIIQRNYFNLFKNGFVEQNLTDILDDLRKQINNIGGIVTQIENQLNNRDLIQLLYSKMRNILKQQKQIKGIKNYRNQILQLPENQGLEESYNQKYEQLQNFSNYIELFEQQISKIQSRLQQIRQVQFINFKRRLIEKCITKLEQLRIQFQKLYEDTINIMGQNRLKLKGLIMLNLANIQNNIKKFNYNELHDAIVDYFQGSSRTLTNLTYENQLNFQKQLKKQKKLRQKLADINKQLQTFYQQHSQLSRIDNCQILKQQKYDHDYNQSKVTFHYVLYKEPCEVLILIFLPMFILGVINIFILFQELGFKERIANITTLMISLVGMLEIMQKQMIAEHNGIFHFIFFIQFVTPLGCLIWGLYFQFTQKLLPQQDKINQQQVIFPDYDDVFTFVLYLSCFSTLLNIIPLIFYIKFKLYDQKYYRINLKFLKNFQPMYLLLPGSQQVDKRLSIAARDQQKQKWEKWYDLHSIIISIVLNYFINVYYLKLDVDDLPDQTIKYGNLKVTFKQFVQKLKQSKENISKLYPIFRQSKKNSLNTIKSS